MSSTQYNIYRKQTFNLAKTLIIKLDEVSLAINQDLDMLGKPLFDEALRAQYPNAPIEAFYKYYLNLSGQYHITDIERLTETTGHPFMTIRLIGNSGTYEVDFTKELLMRDPAVANEYRFGSYYYNELVSRYPDFEPLIMGILYPVKLEIAVAANNGEILYVGGYIKDYLINGKDVGYVETSKVTSNGVVEPQETNFIVELQTWLTQYINRWTNPAYALTDDLYVAASISIMYMQIPAVVMNIRLKNCQTPYAHSFHIKEYLESHGRLGHVYDNLPLESTVWLYRNMPYYEANLGKEFTLKDIVDNVFTPAKVPLTGYDTTHNVGLMPGDILPTPAMVKNVLNFDTLAASSGDKSIYSMLLDGVNTGRDNERDMRDAQIRISEAIRYSNDDTLSTKILESEMLSLPGRYPFTLVDVLLNLWLYAIDENDTTNKSLDGAIFITNPLTGSRITMTLANAYKVALYCFNKGSNGHELLRPPSPDILQARMIPRSAHYTPTPLHHPKISIGDLWGVTNRVHPTELAELYSMKEWSFHFINNTKLNEVGTDLFLEMIRQFNVYTKSEHYLGRAQLEMCMNRHYWAQIPCKVTIPTDYPVWLEQIGVTINGLSGENLLNLGLDLVAAATGLDLTLSKRQADAQRAAVNVLKHFTSYTVQIVDSISFDTGSPTDMKSLRVGDIVSDLRRSKLGRVNLGIDMSMSARMRMSGVYEEFGDGIALVSNDRQHFSATGLAHLTQVTVSKPRYRARMPIHRTSVLSGSIDIPNYYIPEIPPTPVTEAKDLTYYQSEKYPNDLDD